MTITDATVETACETAFNSVAEPFGWMDALALTRKTASWETVQDVVKVPFRVAMRAALEAADRAAWQPIETAPKTRGAIMVWCPEYLNIYIVTWWNIGEPPGWFHFGGGGSRLTDTPTHWRPLSAPPSDPAP